MNTKLRWALLLSPILLGSVLLVARWAINREQAEAPPLRSTHRSETTSAPAMTVTQIREKLAEASQRYAANEARRERLVDEQYRHWARLEKATWRDYYELGYISAADFKMLVEHEARLASARQQQPSVPTSSR